MGSMYMDVQNIFSNANATDSDVLVVNVLDTHQWKHAHPQMLHLRVSYFFHYRHVTLISDYSLVSVFQVTQKYSVCGSLEQLFLTLSLYLAMVRSTSGS